MFILPFFFAESILINNSVAAKIIIKLCYNHYHLGSKWHGRIEIYCGTSLTIRLLATTSGLDSEVSVISEHRAHGSCPKGSDK